MNYEIVTVATHNEGMFNELINNKYNAKIKILGWKEKWTGFKMKCELIYDYLKNKNDNTIVIFLDGFDTLINNNPNDAIKIFKNNNYKLVLSKNIIDQFNGQEKKVYNTCKNDLIANVGMYMGYVKYLKIILKDAIQDKCKDDQIIFNNLCHKYDFIQIDEKEEIFKNIKLVNKNNLENKKAIFVSFPGSLTMKRIFRGFFEYGQFFFIKGLLIVLLICFLLTFFELYYILLIFIILILIYSYNMDYSCI